MADYKNTFDFSIRGLGSYRYDSPMHLSHEMGDFAPNFVGDDERIIYAHRLSTIKETLDRGLEPYSFEAAGPRNWIYFNPKESRAAIVTCGGLCPGINDVIRGLVYGLKHHYGVNTIYGIRYGYKGLVEESELEPIQLTTEKVEYIINQGGTYLGSSRGPQSVEAMIDFMQRRGINMLFTIGGDGTQRGALELAKEASRRNLDIAIVGIPKTIDNDVRFVEKSFGFESAYSTATQVLQTAHAEAIGAYNGIAIVKLMGRHSGFIAANASVASGEANFTLVPEIPFDLDPPNGFLAALEKRIIERHHALVVVAEGAGQELMQSDAARERDASGNLRLKDIGVYLKEKVEAYFLQKEVPAHVKYIDPSYFIRSVAANASDRMFCLRLAHNAVHAAMAGRTGMIVGFWNAAFTHVPIEAAVSERKRIDPEEDLWLSVLETTGQPNRMSNR